MKKHIKKKSTQAWWMKMDLETKDLKAYAATWLLEAH